MTRAERLRAAAEGEKLEGHVRVVMFAKDHGYVRFPGEDKDLLLVDYDSWLGHWSALPSLKSHTARDAAIRAGLIALAEREERV